MTESLPPPVPVQTARLAKIGLVCVAAATVGFFSVLRDRESAQGFSEGTEATGPEVSRALSYAGLRDRSDPDSIALHQLAFDRFLSALPASMAPVSRSPEDRDAALQQRASRRAFNGAPPVIPHVVDQQAEPNCLVCHQTGMVIDGKTAPAVSHPPFASCLQCHVVASAPSGLTASEFAGNSFSSVGFAHQGGRAWSGAPPVVPHSSWMRNECGSCHGVSGRLGIRTTHPSRQSCVQCHALSADLDQRELAAGAQVVGRGAP
ncbi:MAG: diheme cytochrome precursor [Pseudomonadota bacterium]